MPDMHQNSVAADDSSAGSPGTVDFGSPTAGSSPLTPAEATTTSYGAGLDADGAAALRTNGSAHAWALLGGEAELLERVSRVRRPELLPARLPVLELAYSTVAACSLAAAELSARRRGETDVPAVRIDDGAVATAFTSERRLLVDDRAPAAFAPLSRFWPTADGWVRTHANYPHHRARLLAALGVPDDAADTAGHSTAGGTDGRALVDRVAAELGQREADEVETSVCAAGGLAVAVRDPSVWARHPQGVLAAGRPLIGTARLDQAPPLPLPALEPAGHGPLHGVRVLDLTRVIAGPVATRTLALLGADVLRLDAPQLRELPAAHADTGFGKRSAPLDLSSRAGQATFEELLAAADVVVTGYRPGSLDRFGLAPESLAGRRPGIVVGQLSAWGAYGPWHRRRGFDSLVQAASGIAVAESRHGELGGVGGEFDAHGNPDGSPGGPADPDNQVDGAAGVPGALPAQALDHGTGYLLAAAVIRSLTEQRRGNCGSRLVRVALTQTASWLLNGLTAEPAGERPHPRSTSDPDGVDQTPDAWLTETDGPLGRLRHALPPVRYDGSPLNWAAPPSPYGHDAPVWR